MCISYLWSQNRYLTVPLKAEVLSLLRRNPPEGGFSLCLCAALPDSTAIWGPVLAEHELSTYPCGPESDRGFHHTKHGRPSSAESPPVSIRETEAQCDFLGIQTKAINKMTFDWSWDEIELSHYIYLYCMMIFLLSTDVWLSLITAGRSESAAMVWKTLLTSWLVPERTTPLRRTCLRTGWVPTSPHCWTWTMMVSNGRQACMKYQYTQQKPQTSQCFHLMQQ